VPASAVAQILVGLIIKRYNLKLEGILKLALASTILSLVFIPVYLTQCYESEMAGILKPQSG